MKADYRIPTGSVLYLLLGQLLLLLPLMRYLPPWIMLAWFFCGAWLWRISRQKAKNPGKLMLLSIIVILVVAQGFNFRQNPLGLEPSVSLLLIATSLKMLEIHGPRDVFIVCFMAFLIAPVQFLFDQDMSTAAWIYLVCLPVLVMTLFSLQSDGKIQPLLQLKSAGKLLLVSLPMMLVVFLVFPRMSPLWTVPMPGNESRTGLSDSITPGSFAKLGKSTELAFRVKFKGDIPPQDKLYWRAIVFERLQIDTWKPAKKFWRPDRRFSNEVSLNSLDPSTEYEVTIEPNYKHWLYALDVSRVNSQHNDMRTSAQLTFYRETPNMSAFAYSATASLNGYFPQELSPEQQERLLDTPKIFNQRTRAMVNSWVSENDSPEFIIDKALELFSREFRYTLEPPPLGRHSVDDLVFNTKLGFCEHFASAFAVMMRMAGIPARLVGGYQGGEINRNGNYLLVHQSDAHAWVEVWLEGQGWTRIDPTSVVSPERISEGLARAVGEGQGYLSGSIFSMRRFDLLSEARFWLDELDYEWQRWVIGYRSERQMEVLGELLGGSDLKRVLGFIIGSFVLILVSAWLYIFYQQYRHRKPAVERAYDRFTKRLANKGYPKPPWQGAREYFESLSSSSTELDTKEIEQITREYIALQYKSGNDNHTDSDATDFIKRVNAFKP